ncbi:hypothetical protein [Kineococcus sp. SYSU DK001]|uniref:hypothetical protein n=1 Tax=Kineococcus sp. SYSU DK001 TaxID=3383122 RepID=UPI003D7DFD67
MTQRRTPQQKATSSQELTTWLALAVAMLAISMPQWIQALSGEKPLGYLPAAGFTVAAVLFAVRARRCARRRSGR